MSVKVFPASVEIEYPVRLSAGIQQTSESLNPTTTLLPEAATLVSLCVFCGDPLSSAKQVHLHVAGGAWFGGAHGSLV